MIQKEHEKKTEPLAPGALKKLSNEYQHDRVSMVFKRALCPCALDKSSLSIGRVKTALVEKISPNKLLLAAGF